MVLVRDNTKSMNYKELTAPELVKLWRQIVNERVSIGRDAKLLKDFLGRATSAQILCGMYQYKGSQNISIPIFLHHSEDWILEDEVEAEIELAIEIAHSVPPAYYIWKDFCKEEDSFYYRHAVAAQLELKKWADGILE